MAPSQRWFVGKVPLISSVACLLAGALAYQLLSNQFYVGEGALFATYLRSESNPAQWSRVMTWQFPMLLARGVLIALSLVPFHETLCSFGRPKRVFPLFMLFFVLLHLAAAAPSPSNLEGIDYMRPELIGVVPFLLTQPEMIAQSLLCALGVGLGACRKPSEKEGVLNPNP